MAGTILTVEMVRGDTKPLPFTVRGAGGAAVDLTGCALRFTAKRAYADPDAEAVIVKTTAAGGGIVVVDAAAGRCQVVIVPNDTVGVPREETRLVWDLQLQDATGAVYTVARGVLVIYPDVSVTAP